ncbi:MAG: glycosyltransferase family 2 protein [Deltaproteobacteria bacterium]|nr:glycosyltransferase family 2 protein [Deltaproteobacteria bacterium]MBW1870803.1 glycosyltransferase family 2 protein [Deltaproteobacteria bacterium]
MKTVVVIPAYNAAQTLPAVIERIPTEILDSLISLIIVNDGSRDGTAEVAEDLAGQIDCARVIHVKNNCGYGATMKLGLSKAVAAKADKVVCLHADGQYAPEMLPKLLIELSVRKLDILQGSRIASGTALSGGMPLYKYVAGRALTFMENRVFGLGLSDYHSGYMLYGRKALEQIPFERLSDSFDFDLQMIASARARGLAVGELPIPTRYAGEVSYLNPVRYGFSVLRVMFNYLKGDYS